MEHTIKRMKKANYPRVKWRTPFTLHFVFGREMLPYGSVTLLPHGEHFNELKFSIEQTIAGASLTHPA